MCFGPAESEMPVGQPSRASTRQAVSIQSSVGAQEAHVGAADLEMALKISMGPDMTAKRCRRGREQRRRAPWWQDYIRNTLPSLTFCGSPVFPGS